MSSSWSLSSLEGRELGKPPTNPVNDKIEGSVVLTKLDNITLVYDILKLLQLYF